MDLPILQVKNLELEEAPWVPRMMQAGRMDLAKFAICGGRRVSFSLESGTQGWMEEWVRDRGYLIQALLLGQEILLGDLAIGGLLVPASQGRRCQ